MKKQNEYPIPKEIIESHIQYSAALSLRERYIRIPFGYKNALKCTVEAQRLLAKFWKQVYQLYPELKNKKLTYSTGSELVETVDEYPT